jgi:hypothetical protein
MFLTRVAYWQSSFVAADFAPPVLHDKVSFGLGLKATGTEDTLRTGERDLYLSDWTEASSTAHRTREIGEQC